MHVRNPFGAEVTDGGVRFALWAPAARDVALELATQTLAMESRAGGWFELTTSAAAPGSQYAFRIDGGYRVPDPASRFQPEGVSGPSEVIDPAAFAWPDRAWRARPWEELVFYELHTGTFTPGGTYAGVVSRLDYLVELGITALELMPLAAAPGRRGWGYDGVLPYAPDARYGRPDDLRALIAAAHARGLCVFLDVVYNHFGPQGNALYRYAPQFFTQRVTTPWGAALDFSVPEVRAFFVRNATYWLREYGFDGLRLDAVHAIHDPGNYTILEEIAAQMGAIGRRTADGRAYAVLENDDNAARYLKLYAAQWNDDAHHALHVLLTGETGGYYGDYASHPIGHLARTLTEGYAYQGEASRRRAGAARGEASAGAPLTSFVTFLQNHDQIGNRPFGERLGALAGERALRAAAALLFLAPSLPLLFMGEEWGASTPFLYFCDFEGDLARDVREGRLREFAAFARSTRPAAGGFCPIRAQSRRLNAPRCAGTNANVRLIEMCWRTTRRCSPCALARSFRASLGRPGAMPGPISWASAPYACNIASEAEPGSSCAPTSARKAGMGSAIPKVRWCLPATPRRTRRLLWNAGRCPAGRSRGFWCERARRPARPGG